LKGTARKARDAIRSVDIERVDTVGMRIGVRCRNFEAEVQQMSFRGDPSARLRDDARERLARTRDALKEANDRLTAGRAWYDGVRQSYGEGAK
jgi:hypothetical protein